MHEDTAEEKSPRRSALGILGKVFTIFGYLLLALFVAVVIAYNYVMRPEFLEPLIKENFSKFTNGKIELKLEQTSLFRGFRIRDLVVYSPEGYSETPLLKLDQLNILYNAYGFFRGSFGVHEILLRNPQIFIEQRNNQTNIEALFKPTAEKKEEQKEEVKEDTPAKALYWFFNIHLFARITLEKLQLTFDARDKSNSIRRYANLKDFSFHFAFLTRDFNRLDPGDPAALAGLLQALVIELNPQKKIQIAYEGPEARMRSDFHLFWLLFYDGLAQTPEFVSRFLVGDEKLELALGRGRSGTMPFVAEHAIDFDPKTERLEIRNFAIRFLGDTLLSLKGGGEKLLRSDRKINISTGDSRVNLGKIYDLIATLLGKRDPYFSGYFSLKPTNVTIEGNRVDDSGGLKLEQVVFGTGALRLSVPQLDFDHAVLLDPAQKPLPVSRVMAKLRGNFNGAAIFLDALLAEDRKTNVEFSLRGLEISPFAQGQAAGAISTVLSLKGPSPEDLALALRIYSPQLIYYVDRSKSGINRIDFNVRGAVKSSADFRNSSIQLASITFTDKNKDYATAVELKSRADIQKDESIRLVYTLDGLGIFFQEALLTLPASLQEQLAGTLQTLSLGNTLRADGQTVVAMRGREQQIEHTTHLAFPDIHADDIQLLAKLKLTPAVVYLEQFSITGLRQALQVKADGTLRKATELVTDETTGKKQRVPTTIPDLRFRAELGRKTETEILDNTFIAGSFELSGRAQGNIVDGKILIDNLSLRNLSVRVHKVNLQFPFRHDLKLRKTLNLRAGNKERIIKNYNFNRAYNFTVQEIEIPNPNNKKEWMKIIYPRGNYPAIGATMEYKDNVFIMPVMQLYMLNGVVTISDTLFNLGRLRPKEMEYSTTIQVKDIDLKQLIPKEKADTITDGKLRIDILLTGNRLDKPVENLNGYLSIYHIGPEFAESVVRAAMPQSGDIVHTVAANTTVPKTINIELRDGLVNTDIPLRKKIIAYMLPSPDEFKNDRINIPEFFRRIRAEASTYTTTAPSG